MLEETIALKRIESNSKKLKFFVLNVETVRLVFKRVGETHLNELKTF